MNNEIGSTILGRWYFIELNVLTLRDGGLGDMDEEDHYAGVLTCPITWDIVDSHIYIYKNSSVAMILDYDKALDILLDITDSTGKPTLYSREKRPFLTEDDMKSAVMGLCVGGALGGFTKFNGRDIPKKDTNAGMLSYDTHNLTVDTWSDDFRMLLATIDWYKDYKYDAPDYEVLMQKFGRLNGKELLMRILAASLMEYDKSEHEFESEIYINHIFEISALTHGHIISKLACLIYSYILIYALNEDCYIKSELICKAILKVQSVIKRFDMCVSDAEYHKFDRIWNCAELIAESEDDIKSNGHVIDTLEAAIWCFVNTEGYKECVLKAVSLGNDTDNVGAAAGGLAGLYYGINDIPEGWKNAVTDRDSIESLIEQLYLL